MRHARVPTTAPPRWPEPRLAGLLFLRAILAWALVRATLVLVTWLWDGMPASPAIRVTPWAAVWLTAVIAGAMMVDLHRRGELVLHANLGTGMPLLFLTAALAPAAGELLVFGATAA